MAAKCAPHGRVVEFPLAQEGRNRRQLGGTETAGRGARPGPSGGRAKPGTSAQSLLALSGRVLSNVTQCARLIA